ncbi:MAG: Ldh family oxidoreductase [Rhodospirillales bacterium]|mgnify:CR=1 FL=1|jgi:(2R)-3-sulfolactate dehydrogenase (NADP+)|nr:Ldh family oxidoreductase [Rhodospirillales bacterium]
MDTTENKISVSIDEIEKLTRSALLNHGASEDSARIMAFAVARAEADGNSICGLFYVPIYCEHLHCGRINKAANITISTPLASVVKVDADNGFAHPAIEAGLPALIEATNKTGCATLAINHSYNCAALGLYTEELSRNGLIAMGFANSPASIAPPGGIRPVLGTNPIAMSVPDGNGDVAFQFDQSTSAVAKTWIMAAAEKGEEIPLGWAIDSDGEPTTNAKKALDGAIAPFGGYKGFGIGLMVETFTALMSGAALSTEASRFVGPDGGYPNVGQSFIAMDPKAFVSSPDYATQTGKLCQNITNQDGARLPGSRSLNTRITSKSNGILIDTVLFKKVQRLTN